ncbi:hypothetical protein [Tenacibaculum sp. M341]|uniref:hypothetical protein n=1 Tax=Tenacibaculum sp. M341 TaxID=2530339 RepID=UPI001045EFFC|nr:hypothetical protein [Tenacibaculum sp. M341]TCI90719.1 hypothetical protein EYW44_13435 [Tenacibaculum sp. M341]
MDDKLRDFVLNNDFDIYEPHSGHEDRFLKKLEAKKNNKNHFSWKWLSIAATITLLIGIFIGSNYTERNQMSEMAETESFFINTINQELKEIERHRNIETESIIEDALEQIEELEDQFKSFKNDLETMGNEKQIIKGMIDNYQQRLQILENLLYQLDVIKNPEKQNEEFNEII